MCLLGGYRTGGIEGVLRELKGCGEGVKKDCQNKDIKTNNKIFKNLENIFSKIVSIQSSKVRIFNI